MVQTLGKCHWREWTVRGISRLPLSGPAIGFPLAQYRPRRYQQASMFARVVGERGNPSYVIRTLYDIQMAANPAAYTRMIDIMRIMSYTFVERFRGMVYRPMRTLDRDARRAGSVLGLVGSRLPADLLEEEPRTAYFAAVLPGSPAEIMQPLLAVSGHPLVWAAEFLAAASRHDAVTIREELLVPYLLPQNEDLTKFRFLTLAMAEFACIWSALWMAERSATPEELARILGKLDLLCPSYQKRLFLEDITPEDMHRNCNCGKCGREEEQAVAGPK